MNLSHDNLPIELARLFEARYGSTPRIFQAPGRVNLIGEHTDYNDGFVMPAAIDFHTWVAATKRDDTRLVMCSTQFKDSVEIELENPEPKPQRHWSDYVHGVAIQLQMAGFKIGGTNLALSGNVPIGAGVSSSASVEVACAFALASLYADCPDRMQLAKVCQRAENEFVGARCGIMDQFVSANGRDGHALMLDCRSLKYELLPIPPGVSLVICNTMVKHQIASGEYNVRRQQCEQGVKSLRARLPGIQALRDVSLGDLLANAEVLDPTIFRRCRHVVTENERLLKAASALRENDLRRFGELMYASHKSLRDDYEVSCPELDLMVSLASGAIGVFGARMTGGGFGGCTINLVENDFVEPFKRTIETGYQQQTGIRPEVFVTKASDGVSEVPLNL